MKAPNHLRTLATSLSLIILALGFSGLGFISFLNNQPNHAGSIFSAENAYSLLGSSFSVLVGTTFLVAAIVFTIVRFKSERLVAQIDVGLI
jgi:hypothetical protein